MGLRARHFAAVVLGIVTLAPSWAAADPVTVSGTFSVGWARFSFRTYGFTLIGPDFVLRASEPDGPPQSYLPPCNEFLRCVAGDTTNFTGKIGVFVAGGSATIDGTSYGLTRYAGTATFVSPTVVIPNTNESTLLLSAPFTFSGFLNVEAADIPPNWFPVLSTSMVGEGIATATLRLGPAGYAIQGVRYEFAADPVPEPATLLLFASGFAVLARARRRTGASHPRFTSPT